MRKLTILSAALLIAALAVMPGCSDATEIVTTELPEGQVGIAYNFQLEANNADDQWTVTQGVLPPGIGLNSRGKLAGFPTQTGVFNFMVQVVKYDFGGSPTKTAVQALSIAIR